MPQIDFTLTLVSPAFLYGAYQRGSDDARKQARKWLRAGLQEMGIGAKTAAGYGVFVPPPKA